MTWVERTVFHLSLRPQGGLPEIPAPDRREWGDRGSTGRSIRCDRGNLPLSTFVLFHEKLFMMKSVDCFATSWLAMTAKTLLPFQLSQLPLQLAAHHLRVSLPAC